MTGRRPHMWFESSLTLLPHVSRSRQNSDRARGFPYQMWEQLILLKRLLAAGSHSLPVIRKDKSCPDKEWTVPCFSTAAPVATPLVLNFLHEGRTCYKSVKKLRHTQSLHIRSLFPAPPRRYHIDTLRA